MARREPSEPSAEPGSAAESGHDRQVGPCSICALASQLDGAKRVIYWRCGRAGADARFRRYPTLPVTACSGFERGTPTQGLLARAVPFPPD